ETLRTILLCAFWKIYLMIIILFTLFAPIIHVIVCADLIEVSTSRGVVQGFEHDFGDDKTQRFYGYGQVFLGIPYAKPPVGERRFTLPEAICKYNDRCEAYNATFYRPNCFQTKTMNPKVRIMDEDCLYLNVITPDVNGSFPVMVYIHGGSFTTGGADEYPWKGTIRNLVSRGVVVVTIQYRLGLVGFFTTFTVTFPPNRGIYDQIMALQWVNEEIASFGGDANRITIFGQNSGGIAVSDLSLSPLATGLFQQLIQTSGSSIQMIETNENPLGSIHQDRAFQICQINSTDWGSFNKDQDLMECLLHATPQELTAFDFSDVKVWNVAIDGVLLPDYPEKLAESRPNYPVLMGDVLEEYASFLPGVYMGDLSSYGPQSTQDVITFKFPFYDEATVQQMASVMNDAFSNGTFPDATDHLGWTKLITDVFTGQHFDAYMVRDLQWHNENGNNQTWLFTFTHRSKLSLGLEVDGWIPVGHNAELPYLWFYPDIWETYNASDSDFAVADYMGHIWTDFAKNGQLTFPQSGSARDFIEIGDTIEQNSNWRATSDEVYNKVLPEMLGEFPPLKISEESWTKLRNMTDKVLANWNPRKCTTIVTNMES
ncbi:hypothetical protein PFISCL1PPCAC_7457, partial [Pristionchus fissidentatus]